MSNGADKIKTDVLNLQLIADNMTRLIPPDASYLENFNARYNNPDRCCPLDNP